MAIISISLKGIDQAITNLNYRDHSIKKKVLHAIRRYYSSDQSIKELKSIDTDDIVKSVWDTGNDPAKIRARRRNFSSIKSSINADLEKLSRKGMNPENIIIGQTNIFDMSEDAKNDILHSFSDAVNTDGTDIDQISEILKIVTEFLKDKKEVSQNNTLQDIVDQVKEIIKKISIDMTPASEYEETGKGDSTSSDDIEEGEDELQDDEDIETIELDEDEELEEIDIDDEEIDIDEELEDAEDIEEIDDDDIEEVDENDTEEIEDDYDIEEIDDDDIETIDIDEIEEEEEKDELQDNEDIETIEFDEDEELEEIDIDDEEIEEIDIDEELEDAEDIEKIDDDDIEEVDENDIEEIEDDYDIEEIEDDDDIETIDIDEIEEEEEKDELQDDEDIETIELDEDEELEEIDIDDEELKAFEEYKKEKELAENFDKFLGENDKKYNNYVIVPAGTYTIGSKRNFKNTLKLQQIKMPEIFVAQYPVTNSLFETFVEQTGYITLAEKKGFGTVFTGRFRKGEKNSLWKSASSSAMINGACWYQPNGPGSTIHGKKYHPVVQIGIEDAWAFASWIGRRLPSEAEWEAFAGTDMGFKYPWGNEWQDGCCNIEKSSFADTTPVDKYDDCANELNIVDLLGNVSEWTSDTEPASFDSDNKLIFNIAKGGNWLAKEDITITSRSLMKPGFTSNLTGFRCVSEKFL